VEPHSAIAAPAPRDLVAALRAGEAAAFDAVYARYQARLYGFLWRLAGRRVVADDLFQETWLRLARHAPRLAPDTDLGAWLYAVGRNCYRSYRRWALLDQQRLHEYGLWPRSGRDGAPEALAAAGEEQERLAAALQRLPLKYREALLLVGVEGFTPEQAAATLGLSAVNLRQRLSRGRALLRARLARRRAGSPSEKSP